MSKINKTHKKEKLKRGEKEISFLTKEIPFHTVYNQEKVLVSAQKYVIDEDSVVSIVSAQKYVIDEDKIRLKCSTFTPCEKIRQFSISVLKINQQSSKNVDLQSTFK